MIQFIRCAAQCEIIGSNGFKNFFPRPWIAQTNTNNSLCTWHPYHFSAIYCFVVDWHVHSTCTIMSYQFSHVKIKPTAKLISRANKKSEFEFQCKKNSLLRLAYTRIHNEALWYQFKCFRFWLKRSGFNNCS